jgi:mRNA interferase HigB
VPPAVDESGRCRLRIISKKRLKAFWESRKHDAEIAERDLTVWYKLAKAASWENFAEIKLTFPSVDQVGNCIGFDVGNNRFRLIGRVNYRAGILYVLKVMDHEEYDRNLWPESCGCHKPPPKRPDTRKKSPAKGKAGGRRKGGK